MRRGGGPVDSKLGAFGFLGCRDLGVTRFCWVTLGASRHLAGEIGILRPALWGNPEDSSAPRTVAELALKVTAAVGGTVEISACVRRIQPWKGTVRPAREAMEHGFLSSRIQLEDDAAALSVAIVIASTEVGGPVEVP